MSDSPWVVLLLAFVGGGGGVASWLGAVNLWRQRKADTTTSRENRLQADRDTLDKRIADSFKGLEERIIEVSGEARAAKAEVAQLWEIIYTYRRRDIAWLQDRDALARKLIAAGIPVNALIPELSHPVPIPGVDAGHTVTQAAPTP